MTTPTRTLLPALLAVLAFGLLATASSVATADPAATRRTPTHEDIWLLKRVGAPVASPDGQWAAFSVTEPAYDDKQVSDVWLVATNGVQPPRRLTNTRAGESGLTWSADSRRLAFSSKRDGDDAAQVYVLDLAQGGDAQRITSLVTGARAPQFSPDGTQLLFISNPYPGAMNEADNKKTQEAEKARKYNARVFTSFPVRNWDRWVDARRPHVYVQAADGTAAARDLLAGTKLAANPGFGGRSGDGGEEIDATWTPDGKAVVFAASIDRDQSAYAFTSMDLWQVATAGGEPLRLTAEGDSWARPRFTADGKWLAALHERRNGDKVYVATRLASIPWSANGGDFSKRALVTASFDRSVSSFVLAPDGKEAWFSAEDTGGENLYAVPLAGGKVRTVAAPEHGVYTNVSAGVARGSALLAAYESATAPAEIVRIDAAKGTHTALTHFNDAKLAQLDLPPLEEFWFTSKRGANIHNFLVRPPGFDPAKQYPLFVMIHGGPHTMWRDQFFLRWNYHLLASRGIVFVLTNYTGSTGFGEAFAQGIQNDPLIGPGLEVNEAASAAVAKYSFIDGTRQCAGGASYGGHLANWLQASTTHYRCLVSHAGLVNLEVQWGTSDTIYGREVNMGGPHWEGGKGWQEQNPIKYAGKFRTPVLVTVGEQDFRVPLNNSLEYWSALQRMQVPSKLIVFPEENHWILKGEDSRFWYTEVQDWLAKYLLP